MSDENELRFLRALVDKLPGRLVEIKFCEEKFEVSSEKDCLFVGSDQNDCVMTNRIAVLIDYLDDNCWCSFKMCDEDIFEKFVISVMKAVMEKGVTKFDIRILIGSMVEMQPEESELMLDLLNRVV